VPERLSPLEVSMLALDSAHTPGHVGTIDVFEPGPEGFDYERLIALVRQRIEFVPRYRQRIREVPGRLAAPIWVDDENFDLTFHVRQSALPRPGTFAQLREFVGRVLARRLDRSRPLWEMYLVEGLEGDRFALVAKSHLCLVDGIDTVDIGQVLLDAEPEPSASTGGRSESTWRPLAEPSAVELVAGALLESAQDPVRAVQNARGALMGALGVAVAVGDAVGGIGAAMGSLAADALRGTRPPAGSPLTGMLSEQRRVATLCVSLADLKAIRSEHNHTINDVVLAIITGGLRSWLLTRGESLGGGTTVTALVPMSVTEDEGVPTSLGSSVAPHLQTLPIGEPNALMRLHQIAFGTQAHRESGRAVGARSISDIAGFAPTTLHALGVRVAAEVVRKQHDLVITNVPGPQVPMFAAGSRLVSSFPVLPLASGHLLAVGVTSYDGDVCLGINADRDAVGDLDVLVQCLRDALEELLDTTVRSASLRQPTRKATPAAKKAAAKKAAAREQARKSSGQKRAAVRKLASTAGNLGAATLRQPAKRTPRTTAASRAAAEPGGPADKASRPSGTAGKAGRPSGAAGKAGQPNSPAGKGGAE
jgi:diacylglycerol O-acyltransferase / wax synthase